VKTAFKFFALASGLSEKDKKIWARTLLYVIGPDALEVYNIFTWESVDDKTKVGKILEPSVCRKEVSYGSNTC